MAKRGKKYQAALEKFDHNSTFAIEEAIKLAQETAVASFDASVDVAFRLGIDTRKNDQQDSGDIVLHHGTGKTQRGTGLAKGDEGREAEAAGAGCPAEADPTQ